MEDGTRTDRLFLDLSSGEGQLTGSDLVRLLQDPVSCLHPTFGRPLMSTRDVTPTGFHHRSRTLPVFSSPLWSRQVHLSLPPLSHPSTDLGLTACVRG